MFMHSVSKASKNIRLGAPM